MPISGSASYVSTTEEILAHWLVVDTVLGAGNEIHVQNGMTRSGIVRAGMQTLFDSLVAKRLDLSGKLNLQETARGDIDLRKAQLLLRMNQFNDLIRADFSSTKWVNALTNVPSISDGAGLFTPPLDDAATLWQQMDASLGGPGSLKLLGDYLQADFATDIVALKTAYTTWRSAGVVANITLLERNQFQDLIYPVLVNYRKKVPTKFAAGHPLIDSLPQVTPAPGSTPDGVTINVVWVPASQQAKITFTASSATDLAQYELRFCSGPTYNTDLENVVANLPAEATREFLTDAGLATPGNVASFKVYVLTTTGNEKGSNTASIARPPV